MGFTVSCREPALELTVKVVEVAAVLVPRRGSYVMLPEVMDTPVGSETDLIVVIPLAIA